MDTNTALGAIFSRLDKQDEKISFLSRLEYPQTLNGTLTSGSVVFAGSGGLLAQDNSNFFWDNANKRLGIGTNTPSLQLESKMSSLYPALNIQEASTSNRRATMGFGVNGTTATTGWIMGQGLNNDTTKDFYLNDLTAGATRLYIDTSGNVGIGTTSLTQRLHIDSSSALHLVLNTTSGSTKRTEIDFRQSGTQLFEMGVDLNANNTRDFFLYDDVANATRLLVNATGETTLSERLHLNGTTCSLQMKQHTLANNGTAQLTNESGNAISLVFIVDAGGAGAIYLLTGGNHITSEISDPLNAYSPTAGTGGLTNIYWSAGNSRYEIENKRGGSLTFQVFIFNYS